MVMRLKKRTTGRAIYKRPHTFKLQGWKQDFRGRKHFAASTARCISRNISWTRFCLFFLAGPAISLSSAVQKRAGIFKMALVLSDEDKFVFIVIDVFIHPVWRTTTIRLEFARPTYISTAHRRGMDTAGELDHNFSFRTLLNLAHGDHTARSASLKLFACAKIVLQGRKKCVEMNQCGWKPVRGSCATLDKL